MAVVSRFGLLGSVICCLSVFVVVVVGVQARRCVVVLQGMVSCFLVAVMIVVVLGICVGVGLFVVAVAYGAWDGWARDCCYYLVLMLSWCRRSVVCLLSCCLPFVSCCHSWSMVLCSRVVFELPV